MNRIICILVAAVLSVVVITANFGGTEAVNSLLSESIDRHVSKMEKAGFGFIKSDRLQDMTVLRFERGSERMVVVLDEFGGRVGPGPLTETDTM